MRRPDLLTILALAWGTLASLAVRGYQFGRGNHHVYLLDALRLNDPAVLASDWWTTHTFQYHVAFTHFSAWVLKLGVAPAAFLIAHLACVVGLHAAWLGLVRRLGGGFAEYTASVLVYYAMAAGFGLGMYAYLQDSGFLPSNAAAVLLLWAIVLWVGRRDAAAAALAGAAGFWHLNYAIAALGAWGVWAIFSLLRPPAAAQRGRTAVVVLIGFTLILVPSLVNLVPAVAAKLRPGGEPLPTGEFVALYARLRHPHHYDPFAWHPMVWLAFFLPMPLAYLVWRRRAPERDRAAAAGGVVLVVLGVAFVFAGVWWVSTGLVQLSLWRLSVYPKLVSCTLAAIWLVTAARGQSGPAARRVALAVALGGPVVAALCAVAGAVPAEYAATTVVILGLLLTALPLLRPGRRAWPWVVAAAGAVVVAAGVAGREPGRGTPPAMDAGLAEVAAWARAETDRDAIYVTPPGESGWQWASRRATVADFKHVPQLASELPEWHRRLREITGNADLTALPGTFERKVVALDAAYRSRPLPALRAVADAYGAGYIVAPPGEPGAVFVSGDGRWAVYLAGS